MKTSVPLSLEEQVGPGVLGQVGSELFAETNFSLLKPNSLGIICMETRVSTVNILPLFIVLTITFYFAL